MIPLSRHAMAMAHAFCRPLVDAAADPTHEGEAEMVAVILASISLSIDIYSKLAQAL